MTHEHDPIIDESEWTPESDIPYFYDKEAMELIGTAKMPNGRDFHPTIATSLDEDYAQFIVRACNSFHDLISIAQAVKVMGEREESYGCGFYNDDKWLKAREAAQEALESYLKNRPDNSATKA